MFTKVTKMLSLLLLVCVTAAPLGCLTVNKPPDDQPTRQTTVGGEHGVVVNRSDSGTEVKVGGDKGVVVEHPRD